MSSNEPAIVVKLQRQMRVLQTYAVASSLIFAAVLLTALKQPEKNAKFKQIEVQRINVVEPDGTLRLAIFNNAMSPAPILNGKSVPTRAGHRGAGLMFYNDEGSENGGLTYGAKTVNGQSQADSGLMFDQYNQDQVVGITYRQQGNERESGLQVWSRPTTSLADLIDQVAAMEKMPEGPEKTAAMQKVQQEKASGEFGASRVFVGRNQKNEATVTLADKTGKPRIVMSVAADGTARLNFLDATGKVIDSLPHEAGPNGKR
jgi:hypothetical protein